MKWVMSAKDGTTKFADMPTERKWFLACLAWEADALDNRICFREGRDISTLASEAGVSVRAARRYMKEFVAEGVLEAVGRTGYHNRIVIYQFTMSRTDVAQMARAKSASNDTIQRRSNGASNDTIRNEPATENDARNVLNDALNGVVCGHRNVPNDALNDVSNGTIQPPSIYGLQELPITPQEKHNAQSARACRLAATAAASDERENAAQKKWRRRGFVAARNGEGCEATERR